RVRGLDPWPGSFTYFGGNLLKVHRAKIIAADAKGNPGEIIRADSGVFWVAASTGVIGFEEVQLENKKRLSAAELMRGARLKAGEPRGLTTSRERWLFRLRGPGKSRSP